MDKLVSTLSQEQLQLIIALNEKDSELKRISNYFNSITPSSLSTLENKIKLENALKTYEKRKRDLLSNINKLGTDSLFSEKILTKKPVRVYIAGVFDIIHPGHFNALRQAKKFADILVVGVNKDEDVLKTKGPTILNNEERMFLTSACKWGDEFVLTEYLPSCSLLDRLNCDFCVHGDDMVFDKNGKCIYDEIIKKGRLKYFKRTEGVSTTDITRKLLCNAIKNEDPSSKIFKQFKEYNKPVQSKFLFTSIRISSFSNNKVPNKNDKVVYFPGEFDLLNVGIVQALKKAKELGDFLYVGIYSDEIINKLRGTNYPYFNINERTFNLLALRYVDEVIVNPSYKINEEFLKSMKINVVFNAGHLDDCDIFNNKELGDPFDVPKKMGIYHYAKVQEDITDAALEKKISLQKEHYVKKYIYKSISDQISREQSTICVDEI